MSADATAEGSAESEPPLKRKTRSKSRGESMDSTKDRAESAPPKAVGRRGRSKSRGESIDTTAESVSSQKNSRGRKKSRGESMDMTTEAVTTPPRKTRRSKSRGESVDVTTTAAGKEVDASTPTRSSSRRTRSRGESIDTTESVSSTRKRGLRANSRGEGMDTTTASQSAAASSRRKPSDASDNVKVASPKTATPKKKEKSKVKSSEKKKSEKKRKKKHSKIDDTDTPKNTEQSYTPTVDVTVHRIRSIDFRPKPILCLKAISIFHTVSQSGNDKVEEEDALLAISRENGSVELKCASQKLRTIGTIAGYREKQVNVMAWLCGDENRLDVDTVASKSIPKIPPLIGASRDGTIFVVDFYSSMIKSIINSGGGGVFALTSLCQNQRHGARRCCGAADCCRLVAAGCEDGSVRIFRLVDEDQDGDYANPRTRLVAVSTVPTTGAAVLSLAWKKGKKGNGINGSYLFVGVADGTIRRYDAVASQSRPSLNEKDSSLVWRSTLRMTVESYGRMTPTRVWALESLGDGTLISADSLGHVQFWDGESGTLTQSFDQNDSRADVFGLAVSNDECKVFASGVDSRVVCIERQQMPSSSQYSSGSASIQWVVSHAQRPHTHDVHCLAIFKQQKRLNTPVSDRQQGGSYFNEILCTGGLDTKLCTYLIKGFHKKRPRTLYPWPSNLVSVARKARIILTLRETSVDLYRLGPKQSNKEALPVLVPEDSTLIGSVALKSSSNLVCAAVSDDGSYLAMADALGVSLFKLTYNEDGSNDQTSIEPTLLSLQGIEDGLRSITAMCFSVHNCLIMASSDRRIITLQLPSEAHSNDCTVSQSISLEDDLSPGLSIHKVTESHDGKYFLVAANSPRGGHVFVFSLQDSSGGLYRHWWTVPELEAPTTAADFLADDSNARLVVACTNFAVSVFDVNRRMLSQWSESAGYPLTNKLPGDLAHRNDYPVRICVDRGAPSKFFMVRCPNE